MLIVVSILNLLTIAMTLHPHSLYLLKSYKEASFGSYTLPKGRKMSSTRKYSKQVILVSRAVGHSRVFLNWNYLSHLKMSPTRSANIMLFESHTVHTYIHIYVNMYIPTYVHTLSTET